MQMLIRSCGGANYPMVNGREKYWKIDGIHY